uniref:Uncharacterized protein n=1 Tax=Anopheles coluzzii TaxID=1518534 RepID=A0A8W7PKM2_ANOCL
MTKMPTSQSATARLMTKQLVTVRRRRVVITDSMTSVLPITVTTISRQNSITTTQSCQLAIRKCSSIALGSSSWRAVGSTVPTRSTTSVVAALVPLPMSTLPSVTPGRGPNTVAGWTVVLPMLTVVIVAAASGSYSDRPSSYSAGSYARPLPASTSSLTLADSAASVRLRPPTTWDAALPMLAALAARLGTLRERVVSSSGSIRLKKLAAVVGTAACVWLSVVTNRPVASVTVAGRAATVARCSGVSNNVIMT